MLSISRLVRQCVCVSVCVFTFKVPFKCLFPPLPEFGYLIFLEIWNPWGKVMERSYLVSDLKILLSLRFENFSLEIV